MAVQFEIARYREKLDWALGAVQPAFHFEERADARHVPIPDECVDSVVTSPPYWQKRKYGVAGEIGLEPDPAAYAAAIFDFLKECHRVLRPTGSVFLNVGDTYYKQSLAGIPYMIERLAVDAGWILRNRIIWAKTAGVPEPSPRRLANRHEHILHFAKSKNYYYDIYGYSNVFGSGANPGDVWHLGMERGLHSHLAPFPEELVERALVLTCPHAVCTRCAEPRRRIVRRTFELNENRPQAKRALALFKQSDLTEDHLRAIQSTGISDAGKALRIQTGTGRNSKEVQRLAAEAKAVLGGYFREFTFAKKESAGWTRCGCNEGFRPGIVLDPFAGTGTTTRVARRFGLSSYRFDLANVQAET